MKYLCFYYIYTRRMIGIWDLFFYLMFKYIVNAIGTFSVKFQLLQRLEIHGVNFNPYFFHLLGEKNKTWNLWLPNS